MEIVRTIESNQAFQLPLKKRLLYMILQPLPQFDPFKLYELRDNFHKLIFRLTNSTFCGTESH